MAKAKRVFQVAKELGVTSKAIVAKCQAEEVPDITNHMSTVKVGLEATIREWFSEGAGEVSSAATAVEVAEKVDLQKARKGVRRRKATAAAEEPLEQESAAPAAQAKATLHQAIAGSDDAATSTATATAVTDAPPEPADPVTVEAPDDPAIVVDPTARARKVERAEPVVVPPLPLRRQAPTGVPNVPDRPQIVMPAGEQLEKPRDAVLKGPRVVRIDQPDPIAPPRPRRAPAEPGTPPGTVEGITRSRGPVRGRGAGDDAAAAEKSKASKRRSLTTRRGRTGDAHLSGPGNFSEQDLLELDARLKGAPGFMRQRRRNLRKRESATHAGPMPAEIGGTVEVAEPITIKSLSAVTGIKSTDILKYLFTKGIMATINSAINTPAAMEVALEYDIELIVKEQQTAEQVVIQQFEAREQVDEQHRPPVVTVLGHVDHGKTSLLDRIRKADVARHEAGGITQHVGAYRVTVTGESGQDSTVVFLDTPGHQAFTSMRARGAKMTDLIVLVVAADDGVMPQTIESINHAKDASVPIVVALNKIDRPEANDANVQRIYGQLAEQGLNPADWGGDTEIVKTSAETGEGITELLEHLEYQSQLLELSADFGGPARGTVIESQMQEGRGPVARVLVQQGNLNVGDFIVIGRAFGRVRDMTDDRRQAIKHAGPSTPLELSGIDRVPDAGDKFYVTDTLRKADEVANQYRDAERQQQLAIKTKVTLDTFADTLKAGDVKELRVVVKADVQGSLDVLNKSLLELGNEEVSVRVIHSAVGGINESDVLLAEASDAVIIGFHVIASQHARDLAEQRGVDIRPYRVIYDVTDEITKGLEGLLTPQTNEEAVGEAEVREVFKISKVGNIAGCLVTEGAAQRSAKVRVVRDDVVITDNRSVETLRRVKDDASEVRAGTECGLRIGGFDDLKVGDKLVFYRVETVARTLG